MASEWKNVTIGEIATLQRGFDISQKEQRPGPVPVISSGGTASFHDEAKQAGPGVIMGRKGTLGNVYWIDKPYWPHSTSLWVKNFHGNDPKFIYYFFKAIGPELLRMDVGAANPTLNRNHVHPLPALRPPLPQQKAIAHVLGTLDDLIELNRETNEILEEMARALFKSWFVDFDPVRAKLEGRPPAGMDAATAALFPDHFQDSELGQIPKGWEVKPLSQNIELLSGGTPKTSEPSYWDGNIPWYSVRDAPSDADIWVVDTDKRVTPAGIANSAAKILPEKTTIISARGTVGKLALIGRPMAMNQSCYGVRGAAGYGQLFTYYCLKEAVEELQQNAHGSVFDTITRETFTSLRVASPPPGIAESFERMVEPLLDTVLANVCESRDLATLRDTLLPKLLSGEVSAPAAEELIAASR
jgi:type I restriction enzyme S subunit